MLPKSLDTLIAKTRDSVTPLGHSPSTLWQYEYGWRHFRAYAMGRGEVAFSTVLAAEYLQELRLQYEDGSLKEWRFKLARKTVSLLTQQWETGEVWWTHLPAWVEMIPLLITTPSLARMRATWRRPATVEAHGTCIS